MCGRNAESNDSTPISMAVTWPFTQSLRIE
jgi:hypothetical protein